LSSVGWPWQAAYCKVSALPLGTTFLSLGSRATISGKLLFAVPLRQCSSWRSQLRPGSHDRPWRGGDAKAVQGTPPLQDTRSVWSRAMCPPERLGWTVGGQRAAPYWLRVRWQGATRTLRVAARRGARLMGRLRPAAARTDVKAESPTVACERDKVRSRTVMSSGAASMRQGSRPGRK